MNAIIKAMDYQPTWGGSTTAWRQPYSRDLTGVDVAFLGVPWDGTPMWRSGQCLMPRAIREASIWYGFREFITSMELKMVDYGDVLFHPGNEWDYLDQTEKAASEILKEGRRSSPAEETTASLCPWFAPMARHSEADYR